MRLPRFARNDIRKVFPKLLNAHNVPQGTTPFYLLNKSWINNNQRVVLWKMLQKINFDMCNLQINNN